MASRPNGSPIGLLLSGGLDSCILLGDLLRRGYCVQPFYIESNLLWQAAELRAVRRYLDAVACRRLEELVTLYQPVDDVYADHWSLTGRLVPDARSPDEAVYLPGRNALLLVKAALWCQLHGIRRLAVGVLGSSPFADAKADFFTGFQAALSTATGRRLRILRPFAQMTKRQVMRLGRDLPLSLTFSCVAPRNDLHCGRCNKCAERMAAFRLAGTKDPTEYATAAVLNP